MWSLFQIILLWRYTFLLLLEFLMKTLYITKQVLGANKIPFQVSTYGSLKSNWYALKVFAAAHSDWPLMEMSKYRVLWELKHSFVKVAASITVHLWQCLLRELPLHYYYSSLNLWAIPFPYASPLYPFILPYVSFVSIISSPCALPLTLSPFYCLVEIIFFQRLVQ